MSELKINQYLNGTYASETKEFRNNGGIVLSPSGIAKFYNEASEWYLDRIGKVTFDGNSNTVLGNAIHGAIDAYWDHGVVAEKDVELWIQSKYAAQMNEVIGEDKFGNPIPKVDIDFVLKNFQQMFTAWETEYAGKYPKPDLREHYVKLDVQEEPVPMMMAGTIDGYEEERKVVIDYKTCGRKPSGISESHRLQLTAYAFAMIAEGKEVDTIRVVYIQRPTKTLPARIHVFDEDLDDKLLLVMVDTMEMMKGSFNASIKYPELTKYLFRPNRVAKW
jgi:hypothetical protein